MMLNVSRNLNIVNSNNYNNKLAFTSNPNKDQFSKNWPYAKQFLSTDRTKDLHEKDQIEFFNTLTKYIPMSGYKPIKEKETIVSVACGDGLDSIALNSYFGRKSDINSSNENTKVYSIDINEDSIDFARHFFSRRKYSNIPLTFIHGDATKLSENKEIPKNVDAVIIRNQQLSYSSPKVWKDIIQESYKILREGGVMLITSYTPRENDDVFKTTKNLGYKVTTNESNSTNLDEQVDKNIITVIKE